MTAGTGATARCCGRSASGLSTLVLFMAMPVFGAIADFSAAKRRFMQVFAYGGALFTTLLFFATTGNVLFTLGVFFLAQLGFVGANVFYDGFLKDITTEDTIDKVSSKGFAVGYFGGGLWLAIVFGAILASDSDVTVIRAGIAATGLWWAGFSWFAFSRLKDSGASEILPEKVSVARSMIRGVQDPVRRTRHWPCGPRLGTPGRPRRSLVQRLGGCGDGHVGGVGGEDRQRHARRNDDHGHRQIREGGGHRLQQDLLDRGSTA